MWNNVPDWLKKTWAVLGVLIVLIGGAAAAVQIVDFCEDRQPTPTPPPTATFVPIPTSTPIETATPTPIRPFQFLELPEQVKAGEDVKVVLQAWQGATCFLAYYTADGGLSSARGLGPVSADSQGRCSWEWHISANTLPGQGTLVISINDLQETHKIEILP
jgi:hypothetical protein